MNKTKKILSIILAAIMILSVFPMAAFADFDLATYKQEFYEDLSIFIDDNISRNMQKLDSFQKQLGKISTAVEAAETKVEVDEIRAQALQTLDEFIPDEYTVTVQGAGTLVGQELNINKSTKYEIATVTITDADGIDSNGNWFVYWKDVDTGEIVSSYSTYKFFVTKDITLTPVYVNPGDHSEHTPYNNARAEAVITSRMVKSEKNVGGTFSLISEYSVSAAAMPAALQGHGIICTTDEALANETDLVCTNDAVEKYAAVKTATDYVGTQKVTLEVSELTTVYARPYIVDGDGNVYYGNVKWYELDPTPSVIVDGYEDEIVFCGAEDYSLDVAEADEVVPTAVETEPEAAETANWFTTLISFFTTIINWFMQILGI